MPAFPSFLIPPLFLPLNLSPSRPFEIQKQGIADTFLQNRTLLRSWRQRQSLPALALKPPSHSTGKPHPRHPLGQDHRGAIVVDADKLHRAKMDNQGVVGLPPAVDDLPQNSYFRQRVIGIYTKISTYRRRSAKAWTYEIDRGAARWAMGVNRWTCGANKGSGGRMFEKNVLVGRATSGEHRRTASAPRHHNAVIVVLLVRISSPSLSNTRSVNEKLSGAHGDVKGRPVERRHPNAPVSAPLSEASADLLEHKRRGMSQYPSQRVLPSSAEERGEKRSARSGVWSRQSFHRAVVREVDSGGRMRDAVRPCHTMEAPMAMVASAAVAERKEGGVYWWSVSRSMSERWRKGGARNEFATVILCPKRSEEKEGGWMGARTSIRIRARLRRAPPPGPCAHTPLPVHSEFIPGFTSPPPTRIPVLGYLAHRRPPHDVSHKHMQESAGRAAPSPRAGDTRQGPRTTGGIPVPSPEPLRAYKRDDTRVARMDIAARSCVDGWISGERSDARRTSGESPGPGPGAARREERKSKDASRKVDVGGGEMRCAVVGARRRKGDRAADGSEATLERKIEGRRVWDRGGRMWRGARAVPVRRAFYRTKRYPSSPPPSRSAPRDSVISPMHMLSDTRGLSARSRAGECGIDEVVCGEGRGRCPYGGRSTELRDTRRVLLPAVAHRATVSSRQCACLVILEDCVREVQT
ncbi:hypothetical protein DFH08DRAFT_813055 [Mycena albidolilacea]|uniref:Uncharacterized protein n=1 Tax=Mycena albidolilacea TaxID=1033008 RepID=A0AAD6ZRZ8_9AGAR|nr:hypothetical protein DFH08DRAFT_813055 [Mycena albidolilacea]